MFKVIKKGKPVQVLEVRKNDLTLVVSPEGHLKVGLWVESTAPGMTLDDRGEEGWDSPVLISFDFDAGSPFKGDLRGQKLSYDAATPPKGSFYYYEHTDLQDVTCTVSRSVAGEYHAAISGHSGEGDWLEADVPLGLTLALVPVEQGEEKLLALFEEGITPTIARTEDGTSLRATFRKGRR